MSISNQTDKIFGTGDGSTTVFSFPFKIFAPSDLVIYEIDTTQTPNVSHQKTYLTDYSVSINAVGEGGTVTFTVAPPLSWQTLIQRVEPFTQSLVLNTEGNLPASQIENQLDLMTMLCIQVNEAVSRCPQLPVTYSGSLPLTMPAPQAGLILGWDPTGSFLVNLVSTTIGNIAVPISNGNIQTIVTAGKVSGAALFNLGSIPSTAGVLPGPNGGIPTGTILMTGGATADTGYLLCDGTSYSRTTYAALFARIGTAYGTADGSHFNVPDFRGLFPRGVDNGAGNDTDTSSRTAANTGGNTGDNIGSVQADQFKQHNHTLTDPGHYHTSTFNSHGGGNVGSNGNGQFGNTDTNTTGITIANAGGTETRPKNLYVQFQIKT